MQSLGETVAGRRIIFAEDQGGLGEIKGRKRLLQLPFRRSLATLDDFLRTGGRIEIEHGCLRDGIGSGAVGMIGIGLEFGGATFESRHNQWHCSSGLWTGRCVEKRLSGDDPFGSLLVRNNVTLGAAACC